MFRELQELVETVREHAPRVVAELTQAVDHVAAIAENSDRIAVALERRNDEREEG